MRGGVTHLARLQSNCGGRQVATLGLEHCGWCTAMFSTLQSLLQPAAPPRPRAGPSVPSGFVSEAAPVFFWKRPLPPSACRPSSGATPTPTPSRSALNRRPSVPPMQQSPSERATRGLPAQRRRCLHRLQEGCGSMHPRLIADVHAARPQPSPQGSCLAETAQEAPAPARQRCRPDPISIAHAACGRFTPPQRSFCAAPRGPPRCCGCGR